SSAPISTSTASPITACTKDRRARPSPPSRSRLFSCRSLCAESAALRGVIASCQLASPRSSLHGSAERRTGRARAIRPDDGIACLRVVAPVGEVHVPDDHQPDVAQRPGDLHALRDRKSTRLNSSHVKISYAVFCLKKNTAALL